MSDLRFRPRFRIETDMSCEEVEGKIRDKLRFENPEKYPSTFVKGHYILRINDAKKHFWSPQLDISIREDDEFDFTVIRCLLAPAPVVWTMFMFLYALAGFGALVGLMIASSQYSLDKNMWGLWLAGGSLIFGVLLYIFAQFGKSLSADEMRQLKSFLLSINFPKSAKAENIAV